MKHTKPDIGILLSAIHLVCFLGTDSCQCLGKEVRKRQLLTKAERLNADVIVLDITMPRLVGIEAARRLRRWHPSARLVFLTVHEDADYARAALVEG